MADYEIIESRYHDDYIDSLMLSMNPPPKTEEEQLQDFIKDYIDEKSPDDLDPGAFWQKYAGTISGRQVSKSLAYHQMYGRQAKLKILDDYPEPLGNPHPPTFKPTKKQAKQLRKFRKLKRFK
jgi:hypothetical protein